MADTEKESGLLLDLDNSEGRVLQGRITDKVSFPCSTLEITFTCKSMLVFDKCEGEYYFRYCGLDWVPYRNKFNATNEGEFVYVVSAFPKIMFKTISKPAQNASALARAMGLQLSEGSENLKFKCPIIGLSAYALIKRHRLVSMQDAMAKGDMGEAVFIYCNSQTMTCAKWSTICKKQKKDLQFDELESQQIMKSLMDNRIESALMVPQTPKAWNEKDYLTMMTGVAFNFLIPKGVAFCENYTIKFKGDDSMDAPVPMLCTKQSVDLLDSSKFDCTFTNVQLFKKK